MQTTSIRISKFRSWLAGALLLALSAAAFGQAPAAGSYPNRPIRFVVPFTPGSASDILARTVSERLAVAWGQPVLVGVELMPMRPEQFDAFMRSEHAALAPLLRGAR